MYAKETGRLDVNVAGVVSDINKDGADMYIIVDGEKIFIKHSSASLVNKIKDGEYVKLECYLDRGTIFATNIK